MDQGRRGFEISFRDLFADSATIFPLFDERIVGLFYKWDNHMWTDKFDKYHLISKINSTTYWAFTSGVYGRKSQLCFDNSIMAMGWNYLGDLNQYDKNDFEE